MLFQALRSRIMVFFDVNPNVFSRCIIALRSFKGALVEFSKREKDFYGCAQTADTGGAEYNRKEYGEKVPQDINQESETDKQQTSGKSPGRQVPGRMRKHICIKTKAHR
jgi:hypothetical protein